MAHILLANDDPDLLALCQSLLEEEGHAVESVANGRLMVERAQAWRPDLVVLDWVMPEMDGCAATRNLRSQPATASTPILMMSASDDGDAQARDAGADAFLRKPFPPSDLVRSVTELLGAAANHAQHR